MAENSENKNSPVRLPDELRKALWKETQTYRDRNEPVPTFGDLLLRAWRIFKAASEVPEATGLQASSELTTPDSPKVVLPESLYTPVQLRNRNGDTEVCTDLEWAWVKRTLAVVRSQHEAATKALDSNLDAFVLLAKLTGGPVISGEHIPISNVPEDDLEKELEPLRQAQETTRRSVERAAQTASELDEAGKAVPKKRKRNQGGA